MKSVVTEARLVKRYSTGDYEFEQYELNATVDGKESGAEVLAELKKQINDAFAGNAKKTEEPKTKKGKKANGKGKSSTVSDEDESDDDSAEEADDDEVESSDDDEAADDEDGDSSDDSSEDSEEDDESESEDEEDEPKPAKGKGNKGGKVGSKTKPKAQNYNREVEEHKSLFSSILRSVAPQWNKSDESKAKAKKVSAAMNGKPFLDADGEVLDSFTSEVKKLMSPKKAK